MHPSDDDRRRQAQRAQQLRFASLGLEFAGGIAAFVLLGWWIDARFQTSPRWLVAGAILGCVGGLCHLIRSAYAAQRELDRKQRRQAEPRESKQRDEPGDPPA